MNLKSCSLMLYEEDLNTTFTPNKYPIFFQVLMYLEEVFIQLYFKTCWKFYLFSLETETVSNKIYPCVFTS